MIENRRTSVSLEQQVWDGLMEICRREALGVDQLCTLVARRRLASSLSSALRVFLLTYYRLAARDAERALAGAGSGGAEAPSGRSRLERCLHRFGEDERRHVAG